MARTDNLSNFLTDVATAIKTKKGDNTNIPAANFDTEIINLPSGGTYQTKALTISENTVTTITPDAGYDAIEELILTTNVPISRLQHKSYTFTQNTQMTLTPEPGYDGFNSVDIAINVSGGGMDYTNTNLSLENIVSKSLGYSVFHELYPLPNITDMSNMFANNINIQYLPFIGTNSVTNMSNMFSDCSNLLNLPILNMVNVVNAEGMFTNCNNLSYEGAANIANMLPNANVLTNHTIANLGLRQNQFYQNSMQILIDKGYTDAALAYNPTNMYVVIISNT